METEYWEEVVDPAEEAAAARSAAAEAVGGAAVALVVAAGAEAFRVEEVVVREEEAVVSALPVVALAHVVAVHPEDLFSPHLADEGFMEVVGQACSGADAVH